MILFGRTIGIIGFAWYLLPLDFFLSFFCAYKGSGSVVFALC